MYSLYKPLRNHLRQCSLIPSLHTVHAWVQHLQFDVPLPEKLDHPHRAIWKNPRQLGIFEWELDLLARELVLNAPLRGTKSIESWDTVARVTNTIRDIENETWGLHGNPDDILLELNRTTHRQFPWQNPINKPAVVRYFKIFSTPALDDLVYEASDMRTADIFPICLSLVGVFLRSPFMKHPIQNQLTAVPDEIINSFVKRFSSTFSDLQEATKSAQSYDVNWAYTSNPLRNRPLFEMGINGTPHYMCPIPPFLLRRMTDGIYYELVGKKDFGKAFGDAFQNYVGDVVDAVSKKFGPLGRVPEVEYWVGQNRKDTIDWIVHDDSAELFVECKAKRMVLKAKVDLKTDVLDKELATLASFVCQTYRTLRDALDGQYPNWQPSERPIYPVVVTLDDWYVFGPATLGKVDKIVHQTLKDEGFDLTLLEKCPFTICAIHEFEMAAQVMAQTSIGEVMAKKTSGEEREWSLVPFLQHHYPADLKKSLHMLFRDEWRSIGPGGIE